MNKTKLEVPGEIRYLSQWGDFKLPEMPTIINKQITGCGFTEWCLNNPNINVILCSPRRILLENKKEQHEKDLNVIYFRNTLEKTSDYERDMNSKSLPKDEKKKEYTEEEKKTLIDLKNEIVYHNAIYSRKNCSKILVTYDSFRHIKEALGTFIKDYYIVIDEFQSIFIDSHFKSDTELEFVDQLEGLNRVCYVSATPMIETYLDFLDEFKNLPYIELDWGKLNPSRIIKPQLNVIPCRNIIDEAVNIINKYRSKSFDITYIDEKFPESREAVFFINSVKNICDIIEQANLQPDEVNILCANTSENLKSVKKAFKLKSKDSLIISKVPKKGDIHKMFTLCTRTVYLGADFYSTNAQTFIFSDANVDSLSVDISLDLPQILGRQRLNSNPWKNRATFYYKTILKRNVEDLNTFKNKIIQKEKITNDLLDVYNTANNSSKHSLAENYQFIAKKGNYKDNYISVNTHSGSDLVPVFNKLVMMSEIRAHDIQQKDYRDRFNVFNSINNEGIDIGNDKITEKINEFFSLTQFTQRMKLVCETCFSEDEQRIFLSQLPIEFETFYYALGTSKIKALRYRYEDLNNEFENKIIKERSEIVNEIKNKFKIGEKYTRFTIKEELRELYEIYNYDKAPKASDIELYFNVKECKITNKDTKKRDLSYEILSLKED